MILSADNIYDCNELIPMTGRLNEHVIDNKCNACGYKVQKNDELYWDGCIDCMGFCE